MEDPKKLAAQIQTTVDWQLCGELNILAGDIAGGHYEKIPEEYKSRGALWIANDVTIEDVVRRALQAEFGQLPKNWREVAGEYKKGLEERGLVTESTAEEYGRSIGINLREKLFIRGGILLPTQKLIEELKKTRLGALYR